MYNSFLNDAKYSRTIEVDSFFAVAVRIVRHFEGLFNIEIASNKIDTSFFCLSCGSIKLLLL